jgi:hypothetical protein
VPYELGALSSLEQVGHKALTTTSPWAVAARNLMKCSQTLEERLLRRRVDGAAAASRAWPVQQLDSILYANNLIWLL